MVKLRRIPIWSVLALVALMAVWRGPLAANPDDRHEGYYYPMPGSVEAYVARSYALRESAAAGSGENAAPADSSRGGIVTA